MRAPGASGRLSARTVGRALVPRAHTPHPSWVASGGAGAPPPPLCFHSLLFITPDYGQPKPTLRAIIFNLNLCYETPLT